MITPGPYRAVRTTVLSHAGSFLAQTDVEPHIPEDEARANARLFAAAPDLLEALRANVEAWKERNPWQVDAATTKALAAIAKAEGR